MRKEKEIEIVATIDTINQYLNGFVTDKGLIECLEILTYKLNNLKQIVMKKEEAVRENGVYKSELATYYIKDDKILMLIKGKFYKTSESFMQGVYREPLSEEQLSQFDEAYEQVKYW